ncbi:MAG: hypothetical protein JW737_01685 [Acidobacteria bacterium]|nr:hypothetical protein [Acidobacteriota bacterium]
MRPLIAIFINVLLIGGLFLYMGIRDTGEETHHIAEPEKAEGIYTLDISTTFKISWEEVFLLNAQGGENAVISINGMRLTGEMMKSPFDSTFRINNLPGIIEGKNEVFIELSRSSEDATRPAAVNVEIKKDGVKYFSDVFWFEPEEPVVMTVVFNEDKAKDN